ncbi:hypothetical protein HYV91_03580 [Candidatus Wolfebacteria bacterium]|nr:hypothetical protein [Candidatus Wolfebacteria bacterium]
MKHKNYKSEGFSLLELLIYIAIFGGVVTVIATVLVAVLGGRDTGRARFEVLENSRIASEKIRQLVYDSSSSTVSGACPSNTLNVAIGNATSAVFLAGGVLRVSSSTITDSLTSDLVTAETTAPCLFTAIYNSPPAKPTIQFDLTIQYNDNGNPQLKFSDSIRTTVSQR